MRAFFCFILVFFVLSKPASADYDFFGKTNEFYSITDEFFTSLTTSGGIGQLGWTLGANGTGSGVTFVTTNGVTNRPGIISLNTGTTTTGRAAIHLGLDSILISNETVISFAINLAALSGATNEYSLRIGLGDNISADFTDGIYFEYNRPTSANWIINTANNSVRTKTTSSMAVSTGWTYFRITVNKDSNLIEFAVNGTSIGTISTNIPTASGRTCGPIIQIIKSAGGTSRAVDIDYFTVYASSPNPR